MKTRILLVLYILFLLVPGKQVLAQETKQLGIKKLGKEHGINDTYVSDIVQDKRGVYWASGLNGLIMFDGKKAKRFKLPFYQNKILASNILSTLFFENDSTLWISNTQGVCRFNVYRHRFSPIPIQKDYASQTLNFSVIRKDTTGQIWLSTRELGLLVYDRSSGTIQKPKDSLVAELTRVRDIVKLKSGRLLFCYSKGLFLYDPKSKSSKPLSTEPDLAELADTAFTGTFSSLIQNKETLFTCYRKPRRPFFSLVSANLTTKLVSHLPINSSFGFRFLKDYQGNIWMYNDGVYLYDARTGKVASILIGKSETFSQCYSVYEDYAKNLWFCTNNGLYVLESEQVVLENNNEQVKDEYVSHIGTDIFVFDNHVWVSTYGEGIVLHDTNFRFKKNIDLGKLAGDPDFNNTGLLYPDRKRQQLWVGCILGKIARYDAATGKFRFYNDTLFRQQRIAAFQLDPLGRLFIGTNTGRIARYDAEQDRFILVYNERLGEKDPIDYISNLAFRGKDTLYASTLFNGLYRLILSTNQLTRYKLEPERANTLKSNDLYCMSDLGKQGLFFGSSNGVLRFDPTTERFDAYTPSDGAPFSEVYSICAYENNDLLCTTSDGLYTVDFEKHNARKIGVNSPVEQINFGEAFYLPHKKRILLGSDDYFYTLYYQKRPFTYLGKTYIFELKTTDTSFLFSDKLPEKLKLRRNQNSFTIYFGSAGYKHADDIEHYYQIEELSDAWIFLGSSNEISLNNLKGGTYTFRLKSVNKETKQQVEELVLPIQIRKAFHETSWFYLLLTLSISGVLYLIYRIRLNRALAVEKVRLKLSGDLHDDIGSTLSTINILSSIAEKKVKQDPDTAEDYLRKISRNTQDIMENMSDIVWSINPANDGIQKVISKMREFATTILEPKSIKFELQVSEELADIELKMEYRRDLYLIYKEAINNAAKYAHCSAVKVKLFIRNKHLVLEVMDNGKGFNTTEGQKGNGLQNMKRRAAAIGGILSLSSQVGEGTSIQLTIPNEVLK